LESASEALILAPAVDGTADGRGARRIPSGGQDRRSKKDAGRR